MAILTLEVPDELAARLAPVHAELPQLLAYTLDLLGTPNEQSQTPKTASTLITELLDFFATSPALPEIVDFKFSVNAQDRLSDLLDMNREDELTPHQKAELDTFQQMNHLLVLLKARLNMVLRDKDGPG